MRGSYTPRMAGIDLEAEIDALHALPPARFVAERNALASRLQTAGDRDAAARVRALRRPTAAAALVNRLRLSERDAFEAFLAAHAAMRAAHQRGDPAELRDATRARREALRALVRKGEAAAREAGQAAPPEILKKVSDTLEALAVLGRSAPARAGRLTQELDPPGFEALADLTAAALPVRSASAEPAAPPTPHARPGARTARKPGGEGDASAKTAVDGGSRGRVGTHRGRTHRDGAAAAPAAVADRGGRGRRAAAGGGARRSRRGRGPPAARARAARERRGRARGRAA